MLIKYSELKRKDVLNVETGKNLGKIIDLVINESSGEIQKIITSGKKFSIIPCDGLELDFCTITKIGDDVILISKRSKNCAPPCKNEPCNPSPCAPPCSPPPPCLDFDEE